MNKLGRYAAVALAVGGGYLVLLFSLSFVLDGCAADRIEARLAEALDAEVKVGSVSLSLVRGHIAIRDVEIRREHLGHLDITIERLDVDTAPLGWLAVDRTPDLVDVGGVDMLMTGAGALDLPRREKREPLAIGGMHLSDIKLRAETSKFLPGLGKIQLTVSEARTGPVVLGSALDWVFALQTLDATTKLPAGLEAGVHYTPGQLGLSGSVFGSRPIRLPFTMPVPEPGALELDKLRLLAVAIGETVGSELAKSWLKSKVTDGLEGLLD